MSLAPKLNSKLNLIEEWPRLYILGPQGVSVDSLVDGALRSQKLLPLHQMEERE